MFRSSQYTPSCVLLGLLAGTAARRNATTAWSMTSTDLPIAMTLCPACPPALSNLYVYCPGIEPTGEFLWPRVISQDADLVVLRVPLDYRSDVHNRYSDYFVYRVDCQRPRLDLLPNPFPEAFGDDQIAVLRCNDDTYVVAALQRVIHIKLTFKLHLYRRSIDGKQGSWTSQILSVEEPLRDKVYPIPESSERQMYHFSSKVITLGGDKGLVGWVDLWRGILLCDVLSVHPKLRYIPLPSPARGNLKSYLQGCPSYSRDITVNKSKDTIKYIEMEITRPEDVFTAPSGNCSEEEGLPDYIIPGSWTATTWRMPVEVTSSYKWFPHRTVHLDNICLPAGNEKLYRLLDMLLSTSHTKEQEATRATLPLGCLCMAYPALSIDDDEDVVHFSSNGTCLGRMGSLEAVVSVDLRAETLLGVAMLDTRRHGALMPSFVASGISVHLKTGGTSASLYQVMSKATKVMRTGGAENGSVHPVEWVTCPNVNLISQKRIE